jgi:endoribonuclease Dicer
MTCQIFLNLLLHGYIRLSDVNVLIFDECHHAVNDQPMRQVMQQFEHCPRELQPRVLGLTATLLNSNCKAERVKEEVCTLEKTFLSKVVTCRDTPLVDRYLSLCCYCILKFIFSQSLNLLLLTCRYSTNPIEKVVTFNEYDETENRPGMPVVQKGLSLLENVQEFVNVIVFESDEAVAYGSQPPNTTLMNTSRGKANRKLKNLLTDVIFHIKSLGIFGGSLACLAHIIQLERMRKKAEDKLTKDVFTAVITSLLAVR